MYPVFQKTDLQKWRVRVVIDLFRMLVQEQSRSYFTGHYYNSVFLLLIMWLICTELHRAVRLQSADAAVDEG